MALSPTTELALRPQAETVDLGPLAENRQYQHLLAVATSQEGRLTQYAALRRRPGYDLSDPWLVDAQDASASGKGVAIRQLVPGMPCRVMGSGEVVAYLGPAEEPSEVLVRHLLGTKAAISSKRLLALPTTPAKQGDWALVVALSGDQAHLNGRRGLCGVGGQALGRPGFWVMFEPSDPGDPPDMRLVPEANLVTLPSPPAGAPKTPWESRYAALPNHAAARQALTDEGQMEVQLALQDAAEENEDGESRGDASEDIGGSSSDEESGVGVGSLVKVQLDGCWRHARVDDVCGEAGKEGATATLRFLAIAAKSPGPQVVPLSSVVAVREEALALAAVCVTCRSADPEDQLLMCEKFGENCENCFHISCLKPALKAIPKGNWFCVACGPGSSSSSSSAAHAQANGSGCQPAPTITRASAKAKAISMGTKTSAKAKEKAEVATKRSAKAAPKPKAASNKRKASG